MRFILLLSSSLLFWLVLYHSTLLSMAQIWWRSETFAHGFLIFPISLYLIWDKREFFYSTEKKPSLFFSLCLILCVFIWGMAQSVDVLVIQQLMVVLMIPAIVGALFGFKLFKQYLFPLFYLLFAVPFGEFLVPVLQEYTALMTVWGLQVSGVPVFTEGMFISIPEGDFEVAVACSGIRYLIASLALGTLYAYLTYTKLYKQLIFVAASIIVPIIANGVRAYGIVMIAHLSDMKYATGVDHLIYGWLFFGVVIFILFFIGNFWRDKDVDNLSDVTQAIHNNHVQFSFKFLLPAAVLLLGPVMNFWMAYEPLLIKNIVTIPVVSAPWVNKNEQPSKWLPSFKNADSEISTTYFNKKNKISVYYYSSEYQFESQDKELINSANEVFSTDRWLLVSRQLTSAIGTNKLDELIVRNNSEKLLIWSWYEVLDVKLTNPVKIKIVQAFGKLTGTGRGGKFKAIAIPFADDVAQAKKDLESFLQDSRLLQDKIHNEAE